jgi:hypothetical protein
MAPLVSCITEEYWKPIIEAASPEEIAMIDERMKDYDTDPASFIPLEATGTDTLARECRFLLL